MNGQKVFEVLSGMPEEERKKCSFWWLVGPGDLLRNDIQFIVSDLVDDESRQRQVADDVFEVLTGDSISSILDAAESNMSEYAVDGYWDEYQGRYYSELEHLVNLYLTEGKNKLIEEINKRDRKI